MLRRYSRVEPDSVKASKNSSSLELEPTESTKQKEKLDAAFPNLNEWLNLKFDLTISRALTSQKQGRWNVLTAKIYWHFGNTTKTKDQQKWQGIRLYSERNRFLLQLLTTETPESRPVPHACITSLF